MIIGIDPGHHAAARADVRRDGDTFTLCAWRAIRLTRRAVDPWDCASPREMHRTDYANAARAWLARRAVADRIVAEQTPAILRHRASGGRGLQSLVTQAEAAGAIVQAFGRPVDRVLPDDWRRLVLRVAGNDPGAPRAALAAWGWLELARRLPLSWRGQAGEAPPEWAREHVAEAACVAVWGYLADRA